MEANLSRILCKETDFKICEECLCPNWYENIFCHNCGNKTFWAGEDVIIWARKEYEFWKGEGYHEEEADDMMYDV